MNGKADSNPQKPRPLKPKDADVAERPAPESLDDRLDEALSESFPASDPPAVHRT